MVSGKTGAGSRSGPSNRILELAQHKNSKTIWITTVCPKLSWGNQDSIWPLSYSALVAVPTERTQYLARHKRSFSAWEGCRKEEEEVNSSRKTLRPSFKSAQYERIVRLSTPKIRSPNPQESGPPQTLPGVRTAKPSPRLLQLATPKVNPYDFQSNTEKLETKISFAAKSAKTSPRLDMLSVPRLRDSTMFYERGQPEDPIWPVSKGAQQAKASLRLVTLSAPKGLNKNYIPPRDMTPF
ncbi:hypothetical protein DPEC_G00027080 [Dallia pectoralis]|uniref:Uncharacterized protein n=1 Tax=Dallia pectoralis TaxID=75939 RepID=A0ACC2HIL9_DALPE|nr:hypothetical protein DPEC_G00027080 [Dallia pectoralis]